MLDEKESGTEASLLAAGHDQIKHALYRRPRFKGCYI